MAIGLDLAMPCTIFLPGTNINKTALIFWNLPIVRRSESVDFFFKNAQSREISQPFY